ncbi:MAG: protein kinase [Nannocystaceae bacterium]
MDLGLARGSGEPRDPAEANTTEANTAEANTTGANATVEAPSNASASDLRVTQAGALLGTPAYMSPEQFAGREADVRSDIFAFCVTLYEALHGQRPFAGDSLVALAANVLAGKVSPPPRRGRRVPRWLRRIYARGLAVDPEQRFASMRALLSAIERGRARARRRRWGAVALGVAALAGGARGADRYDLSQRTATCAAEGAVIDEVWDAPARERLRAGLLATGAPFAPRSLETLVPWIDRYREAWRAGRRCSTMCKGSLRRGRIW